MKTLIHAGLRLIASLLLVLVSLPAAQVLADPIPEKPPTGNSVLRLFTSGEVSYDRGQVKYIIAETKAPSGEWKSLIAFCPPAGLEKDASGKLQVLAADPALFGDFLLTKGDKKSAASAEEIAKAVQAGELKPETPVLLTATFRLDASLALKKAVLEAARVQLTKDVIKSEQAFAPLMSGDIEKLAASVIMLPVKELVIRCKTPGLEKVVFGVDKYPKLEESMTLQKEVPARFISALFSRTGAQFEVEFSYEAYADSFTTLKAERVAKDFVEQLIDEQGAGGLKYDKGNGPKGDIEILCNRKLVEGYLRRSDWKDILIARGSSLEETNLLLNLFQKSDADLFAVEEKQVVDDFNRNIEIVKRIVNEPGFASTLEDALKNETWSDKDTERYRSLITTFNKNVQGGGGGSFLGLISIGGGGGTSEARSEAEKQQEREALRAFFSDLRAVKKEGKFPIHPSLKFSLVSRARLQRKLASYLELSRPGGVQLCQWTENFNSNRRTIAYEKPSPDFISIVRDHEIKVTKLTAENTKLEAEKAQESKKVVELTAENSRLKEEKKKHAAAPKADILARSWTWKTKQVGKKSLIVPRPTENEYLVTTEGSGEIVATYDPVKRILTQANGFTAIVEVSDGGAVRICWRDGQIWEPTPK